MLAEEPRKPVFHSVRGPAALRGSADHLSAAAPLTHSPLRKVSSAELTPLNSLEPLLLRRSLLNDGACSNARFRGAYRIPCHQSDVRRGHEATAAHGGKTQKSKSKVPSRHGTHRKESTDREAEHTNAVILIPLGVVTHDTDPKTKHFLLSKARILILQSSFH
ncbi:hypothetical protein HG535_0D04660 [Zygotorulaspora mrakii]|uniref:Uncharacterized protein n=1 Tax=Zygotorulaspora mrakii TaxID=42260 RepID=A0A7H9B2P0_ZYGMR|nr:uncharacterized protein HG535_0D04660 [Zygotorulaspora mrakii]QLG72757.1 hypothetical protein HG535_0D04660 [Zygotorulaspora mrakii]